MNPTDGNSNVFKLRPLEYRAVWISDVHLGFKGCKATLLLDFLKSVNSEYLYLVGDIVDIWSMQKSVHWPQDHNNVIRTVLSKARRGTKVVYIPGNHDEFLRDYDGAQFGNVIIRTFDIHTMVDGKQYLVMHGDEFDSAVKCNRLLSFIGIRAYDVILELNRVYNFLRRKLGLPYWSLSNYIKHRVNNAVNYIERFEDAVAFEANRHQVDGLICGHIHRANLREVNGIQYCNTGDWVESCTALVECHDGRLELINWAEHVRQDTGNAIVAVESVA
ncbi:MAG: UDP-2,3-diacylglucosamine diphosphatase [Gammaproteobacteria bacterium]|jgi:UDP-2,3-diacylglucosamine pyrophosphatase LpxH